MPESTRSPLASLVLFMILLAVAGIIVAGIHYYAVDLPLQKSVQAPENRHTPCKNDCDLKWFDCKSAGFGWEHENACAMARLNCYVGCGR